MVQSALCRLCFNLGENSVDITFFSFWQTLPYAVKLGILVKPSPQPFGWPSLYLIENKITIIIQQIIPFILYAFNWLKSSLDVSGLGIRRFCKLLTHSFALISLYPLINSSSETTQGDISSAFVRLNQIEKRMGSPPVKMEEGKTIESSGSGYWLQPTFRKLQFKVKSRNGGVKLDAGSRSRTFVPSEGQAILSSRRKKDTVRGFLLAACVLLRASVVLGGDIRTTWRKFCTF